MARRHGHAGSTQTPLVVLGTAWWANE